MSEKPHFVKSIKQATGAVQFEARVDWAEPVYEHSFSLEQFKAILEKDQ